MLLLKSENGNNVYIKQSYSSQLKGLPDIIRYFKVFIFNLAG